MSLATSVALCGAFAGNALADETRPAVGALTKEQVDTYLDAIKSNEALYSSERDRLTMPDSGLVQLGAWPVVLGGVAAFAGAVVLLEHAVSPSYVHDTGPGLALLGGGLAASAVGAPSSQQASWSAKFAPPRQRLRSSRGLEPEHRSSFASDERWKNETPTRLRESRSRVPRAVSSAGSAT